jgi:hypothetical protein
MMRQEITCITCNETKPATLDNYFASVISHSSARKCKVCAKEYQDNYNKELKEKKLTRRNKAPIVREMGTIYIIAPTNNENNQYPYKIGITSGQDIKKRLSALSTSHWLDLSVYYKSPLLENVRDIEKLIHSKYKDKNTKGEWFNIKQDDIENIRIFCETSNPRHIIL